MTDRIPVKAIYTGSDVTSLGELASGDTINGSYITDDTIDEASLQISNAGTNGQFLSKQSGNVGGLTWAAGGSGGGAWEVVNSAVASGQSELTVTGMDATYANYMIIAGDISFSATTLKVRSRIGQPGNQLTGTYRYAIDERDAANNFSLTGGHDQGTQNDYTHLYLGHGADLAGSGRCEFTCHINPYRTNANAQPLWITRFIGRNQSQNACRAECVTQFEGTMTDGQYADRFTIYPNSGLIQSGRMTLYGIKHN